MSRRSKRLRESSSSDLEQPRSRRYRENQHPEWNEPLAVVVIESVALSMFSSDTPDRDRTLSSDDPSISNLLLDRDGAPHETPAACVLPATEGKSSKTKQRNEAARAKKKRSGRRSQREEVVLVQKSVALPALYPASELSSTTGFPETTAPEGPPVPTNPSITTTIRSSTTTTTTTTKTTTTSLVTRLRRQPSRKCAAVDYTSLLQDPDLGPDSENDQGGDNNDNDDDDDDDLLFEDDSDEDETFRVDSDADQRESDCEDFEYYDSDEHGDWPDRSSSLRSKSSPVSSCGRRGSGRSGNQSSGQHSRSDVPCPVIGTTSSSKSDSEALRERWVAQCESDIREGVVHGVAQWLSFNPECSMPRRTLARYLQIKSQNKPLPGSVGRKPTLSEDQEKLICDKLLQAAMGGVEITDQLISRTAKEVASMRSKQDLDDSAIQERVRRCGGKDWIKAWKQRHNFSTERINEMSASVRVRSTETVDHAERSRSQSRSQPKRSKAKVKASKKTTSTDSADQQRSPTQATTATCHGAESSAQPADPPSTVDLAADWASLDASELVCYDQATLNSTLSRMSHEITFEDLLAYGTVTATPDALDPWSLLSPVEVRFSCD